MKTLKPLFLYTDDIAPEQIAKVEAAGYVPVQVRSMGSVTIRTAPIELTATNLDVVFSAAMSSIYSAVDREVQRDFGHRIASLLSKAGAK